jgi:hypothetical protein
MNGRRRISDAKLKREPGGYAPLSYVVIRSDQFARLSAHAVKLLMDLLAQYRGNNNGDLCAAWTMMQRRGWKSRDTLANALADLTESGFISRTRQGGRHMPSLYGLTFYALDENPKLDVRAPQFPRGAWARCQRTDGPKRSNRYHAQRVNSSPIDTPAGLPRGVANVN